MKKLVTTLLTITACSALTVEHRPDIPVRRIPIGRKGEILEPTEENMELIKTTARMEADVIA